MYRLLVNLRRWDGRCQGVGRACPGWAGPGEAASRRFRAAGCVPTGHWYQDWCGRPGVHSSGQCSE